MQDCQRYRPFSGLSHEAAGPLGEFGDLERRLGRPLPKESLARLAPARPHAAAANRCCAPWSTPSCARSAMGGAAPQATALLVTSSVLSSRPALYPPASTGYPSRRLDAGFGGSLGMPVQHRPAERRRGFRGRSRGGRRWAPAPPSCDRRVACGEHTGSGGSSDQRPSDATSSSQPQAMVIPSAPVSWISQTGASGPAPVSTGAMPTPSTP